MAVTRLKNPAWERQKGETATQFARFCIYRDLGRFTRSIKAACEELFPDKATPGKIRYMERLSAENQWVERAGQFDAHEIAREGKELDKERRTSAKRRLDIARLQIQKALTKLNMLDPITLTVEEARRLLDQGVTAERLELGEVTPVRMEHTGADGEPLSTGVVVYLPDNKRQRESEDTEELPSKVNDGSDGET